jgi:hypothetical protein
MFIEPVHGGIVGVVNEGIPKVRFGTGGVASLRRTTRIVIVVRRRSLTERPRVQRGQQQEQKREGYSVFWDEF